MKKLLLLSTAILFLVGCSNTKTEYSEVLHEKAVIVTLIYSPSEHRTELTNTAFNTNDDDIIGTDWNGDLGIKVSKNYQLTSTTIPEKYGVVFQCQHGTFTVEGSEQKHKILYNKLKKNVGDTTNVIYKEEYLVTYDDKDEKKVVSRQLTGMDFVDAQLLKK
jgi:hypothetical protein